MFGDDDIFKFFEWICWELFYEFMESGWKKDTRWFKVTICSLVRGHLAFEMVT